MKLSQLGEFPWIRKLARRSLKSKGVLLGIGDDAAAVRISGKGRLLLLACDPVIEGVHFDRTATPYQIGWKAMARNLSDIAAMGGVPRYGLVSASLPRQTSVAHALAIHRGLAAAAKPHGLRIVGGDTSHNPHGIHLTVTVIGEVAPSEMIRRAGARVGDLVYVTGALGGSIRGKHLKFVPRIREARFLAQHFRPSAMMDLSDGLAGDLQRLVEQSGVGFEIWTDRLPISRALKTKIWSRARQIEHALRDGEDYELLFTLAPHRSASLQAAWKKRFRLTLTPIGTVRPKSGGIRFIERKGDPKKARTIQPANDHFLR